MESTVREALKGRLAGGAQPTDQSPEGAFRDAVAIMARLRGPDGCPWDQEQNFDSIRKHTIEEAYEVLDAIERRDWLNLTEELGDLLLQILFYSQMAADEGLFTISNVIETLNRKLIRRHPHVFGEAASIAAGNQAVVDASVDGSSARVLANWEQIKKAEKASASQDGAREASLLDSVQRAQPALAEAAKLGSKASKVGFDWSEWRDLLAKVEEEIAELVSAIETREKIPASHAEVEAELGDLLFTVVNLGRHLDVDAEMALRGTNARFRHRFGLMETACRTLGASGVSDGAPKTLVDCTPAELERLWSDAKAALAADKTKAGAGQGVKP